MTFLEDVGSHLRHSHAMVVGGSAGTIVGAVTPGEDPVVRVVWVTATAALGAMIAFFVNAGLRMAFPTLAREGRKTDSNFPPKA